MRAGELKLLDLVRYITGEGPVMVVARIEFVEKTHTSRAGYC